MKLSSAVMLRALRSTVSYFRNSPALSNISPGAPAEAYSLQMSECLIKTPKLMQKRLQNNSNVLLILVLLVGLVSLSACRSSQKSTGDQRIIKTSGGAIVEVEFYELRIHMQSVIPSGDITFRIKNPTSNDHSFKIRGNGIEQSYPNDIDEGETVDFTVNDLRPGTYDVYCTMVGHADLGERLDITVTP